MKQSEWLFFHSGNPPQRVVCACAWLFLRIQDLAPTGFSPWSMARAWGGWVHSSTPLGSSISAGWKMRPSLEIWPGVWAHYRCFSDPHCQNNNEKKMNSLFLKAQKFILSQTSHDLRILCPIPCLQINLLPNVPGTNGHSCLFFLLLVCLQIFTGDPPPSCVIFAQEIKQSFSCLQGTYI